MTPESGAYQLEFVTWTQEKTRNALYNNATPIVIFRYLKVCLPKPLGDVYLCIYLSRAELQFHVFALNWRAKEQKRCSSGLSTTRFTPKRSKAFFLLHFSISYQTQSALKTINSLHTDYLGDRWMKDFQSPCPSNIRNVNRFSGTFRVFPIRRWSGFLLYSSCKQWKYWAIHTTGPQAHVLGAK